MTIDASAALALLLDEAGSEGVVAALESQELTISAVNAAEALTRLSDRGFQPREASAALDELGARYVAFEAADALTAAELRPSTRPLGLSLGDRACLALAIRLKATVLTADRAWSRLSVGVPIRIIR